MINVLDYFCFCLMFVVVVYYFIFVKYFYRILANSLESDEVFRAQQNITHL